MVEKKKFIKEAIKHPGALHEQLHVPKGEKIPEKKLAKAAKAGGKLGQRARLAETLKSLPKHHGKKGMSHVSPSRIHAYNKKRSR